MAIVLTTLIKRLAPGIAGCLALGTAGWFLHHQGYNQAELHYQVKLSQQQSEWDIERRQRAEKNQAVLQAALAEQARLLSLSLEATQRQLATTQQQLKKRIAHAVQTDGHHFTGLGPDSLRLYRAVLGYPNTGAAGVSNTTAGAARTARGISPGPLLDHATECGAWCLTLRNKLEALNAFYTPESPPNDH
ncbi:hypothetical protein M5J15_06310 [Serratia symbiotica]|uniref:hypothetical protein n=1 Tax=Serratia symbiotica TaxID=138074 RepID=UPI00209077E4|nr:hypothetical protein [Serratia symbiotica]USS96494.1 hypothetical protein M5J15_06310 [Serratia symbiotica]